MCVITSWLVSVKIIIIIIKLLFLLNSFEHEVFYFNDFKLVTKTSVKSEPQHKTKGKSKV